MEKITKKKKEYKKISLENSTKMFLKNTILPQMLISEINDENIFAIIQFIVDNFEVPLVQAQTSGEVIDEQLLKDVEFVIDDITKKFNLILDYNLDVQ